MFQFCVTILKRIQFGQEILFLNANTLSRSRKKTIIDHTFDFLTVF